MPSSRTAGGIAPPAAFPSFEGKRAAAYQTLARAAKRYRGLRSTQDALKRAFTSMQSALDSADHFRELRNLPAVWPGYNKHGTPPWPTDAVARLVWLVTSEADVSMPTADEQDARTEQLREEIKEKHRPLGRIATA